MPPKTVTMRGWTKWPSARASSWICTASSRVGATMSATGAGDVRFSRRRARRVRIEIRYAAVLPVPVCACAATSRPARRSGSDAAWTGVARTNPHAAMPARTGWGRSRSEKKSSERWSSPRGGAVIRLEYSDLSALRGSFRGRDLYCALRATPRPLQTDPARLRRRESRPSRSRGLPPDLARGVPRLGGTRRRRALVLVLRAGGRVPGARIAQPPRDIPGRGDDGHDPDHFRLVRPDHRALPDRRRP